MPSRFLHTTKNLHSLFVRDRRSVERLNALLEEGWRLVKMEMEGLPYLAFFTSLSGERPEPVRVGKYTMVDEPDDEILLVVLTRDESGPAQKTVLIEPDEKGYRDLGMIHRRQEDEMKGWRFTAYLPMENRCFLAVFEQK